MKTIRRLYILAVASLCAWIAWSCSPFRGIAAAALMPASGFVVMPTKYSNNVISSLDFNQLMNNDVYLLSNVSNALSSVSLVSGALLTNGSRGMASNLNMGGFSLTNAQSILASAGNITTMTNSILTVNSALFALNTFSAGTSITLGAHVVSAFTDVVRSNSAQLPSGAAVAAFGYTNRGLAKRSEWSSNLISGAVGDDLSLSNTLTAKNIIMSGGAIDLSLNNISNVFYIKANHINTGAATIDNDIMSNMVIRTVREIADSDTTIITNFATEVLNRNSEIPTSAAVIAFMNSNAATVVLSNDSGGITGGAMIRYLATNSNSGSQWYDFDPDLTAQPYDSPGTVSGVSLIYAKYRVDGKIVHYVVDASFDAISSSGNHHFNYKLPTPLASAAQTGGVKVGDLCDLASQVMIVVLHAAGQYGYAYGAWNGVSHITFAGFYQID